MTGHPAIVRDRKPHLRDRGAWDQDVERYEGREVVLEIRAREEHRSLQSNAYWWRVVVEFFRAQWSRERREPQGLPAYTKEQAHEALVEIILGFEDGPHGTRIRKLTRNLTQSDFSKLIEEAKAMAWHDYQARIPEPGEGIDGI